MELFIRNKCFFGELFESSYVLQQKSFNVIRNIKVIKHTYRYVFDTINEEQTSSQDISM